MSVTNMINTTLTGMFANQAALRVTSNNIANVNTEGYARQEVRTETLVIGGSSGGVRIAEISRIVDRYLESAHYEAAAKASGAQYASEFHDRLQGLLGSPDSESHLTARMDAVFASLSELSLNTSDHVVREGALASIEQFTTEVSQLADGIQKLRTDVNRKIQEQVEVANSALQRLQELNPLIVKHQASGGDVTGLMTQASQALDDLAEVLDIKTEIGANGSITVSTSGGVLLLDQTVRQLEYLGAGTVNAETRFNPINVYRYDELTGQTVGSPVELDGEVQAGGLYDLLNLRDNDLRDISLALGELAAQFSDEVNAIHNSYSSVPAPNQLSGRVTQVQGGHAINFTGQTTFAVVDPDSKLVNKVTVDFNAASPATYTDLINTVNAGLGGAGTLALTNGVLSLTSTNAANGVVILDDAADPSQLGGRGFSHYFGMNDLVEASVEDNYDTGLAGTEAHNLVAGGAVTLEVRDRNNSVLTTYTYTAGGTSFNDILSDLNATSALGQYYSFSLDSNGALAATQKAGYSGIELATVSDTTNVGGNNLSLTQLFGIGDRYTAGRTVKFGLVSEVRDDPSRMALSQMDNTVAVGAVTMGRGDQRAALEFQALNERLVKFDKAGDLASMSVSLSQYASNILSNTGFMGQRAHDREVDSAALLDDINLKISEVSGVNLDEELSNMVILQNSFNASARLIATADELMDTILSLGQ